MKRIAVAGAGWMARVRAKAFLATGEAEICGVAAKHADSARRFGAEIGCEACFDDYRRLAETKPDALLIEVPHSAQEAIIFWALEAGLSVLIGGSLATDSESAARIGETAKAEGLVVEAGYHARYEPLWVAARERVRTGALGRLIAARTIALWDGDPATWYYNEDVSGGMPLTHMTYCFINPLRWLLGTPRCVSAFANRRATRTRGWCARRIASQTCCSRTTCCAR